MLILICIKLKNFLCFSLGLNTTVITIYTDSLLNAEYVYRLVKNELRSSSSNIVQVEFIKEETIDMSDHEPSLIKNENKEQRGLCTQYTKHGYLEKGKVNQMY